VHGWERGHHAVILLTFSPAPEYLEWSPASVLHVRQRHCGCEGVVRLGDSLVKLILKAPSGAPVNAS
jgi:hypothetical protein